MPKSDQSFDPEGYAPVAERIRLFYERYPEGRIVTRLVSRDERDVVFRAAVYRTPQDSRAAATGWAREREGDGDVNAVACLENTETSAIGRALANLGFTASRHRPSAEEMAKASRERARLTLQRGASTAVAPRDPSEVVLRDLLALLARAERRGLRPARAAAWRRYLERARHPAAVLQAWERRLRARLRRWDQDPADGSPS